MKMLVNLDTDFKRQTINIEFIACSPTLNSQKVVRHIHKGNNTLTEDKYT